MAKQTVNNGDTYGSVRTKINENFTECYDHNHDGTYSLVGHTHNYEPANANIQSHIASPHAPGTSNYPVTGQGLLISTTNAGTAQLMFRSEVAAVTTAKAGLTLVVEKIA